MDDFAAVFFQRFDNYFNKLCFQHALHYFGVCCSLFAIVGIFATNGYFTCPALFSAEQCATPLIFGYFVLFEVFLNFALFQYCKKFNRVDSLLPPHYGRCSKNHCENNGTLPIISPVAYQDLRYTGQNRVAFQSADISVGMKFCHTCNMGVPWRSHHCPLCKHCVLRKDHHCFFMGGCVGFGNQRYFVVFLFWAFVGASYGSSLTLRYLDTFYQPFWPFGWVDYIFPLAMKKWIFQQHCSILQLLTVFLFSVGFSTAGVCLVFSVLQWLLIYRGKTLMEQQCKKNATNFGKNSTFWQNIQSVFGPYWIVNFLVPLPCKNKWDESFKKWLYDSYVKEM